MAFGREALVGYTPSRRDMDSYEFSRCTIPVLCKMTARKVCVSSNGRPCKIYCAIMLAKRLFSSISLPVPSKEKSLRSYLSSATPVLQVLCFAPAVYTYTRW